jgi:hypothetical protein
MEQKIFAMRIVRKAANEFGHEKVKSIYSLVNTVLKHKLCLVFGRWGVKDRDLRPAWAKSSQDPISTNGWVWWFMPAILATWESTNRKVVAQAGWVIKARPCIKNNQHKKDWQSGSGDTVPA